MGSFSSCILQQHGQRLKTSGRSSKDTSSTGVQLSINERNVLQAVARPSPPRKLSAVVTTASATETLQPLQQWLAKGGAFLMNSVATIHSPPSGVWCAIHWFQRGHEPRCPQPGFQNLLKLYMESRPVMRDLFVLATNQRFQRRPARSLRAPNK